MYGARKTNFREVQICCCYFLQNLLLLMSFQIFETPIKSDIFTLFTYFVFSQYQSSRLTELIQFQKYFFAVYQSIAVALICFNS